MMEDRIARIQQRMLGLQQEMLKVVAEELQGCVNDLFRDAYDPSKLMDFIRKCAQSMGIDVSQLPGMLARQTSFDPYTVLGLDRSASEDEVKQAYRELVNKYHPDKSGTPRTKFAFRLVLEAYEKIKRQRGWQ